MRLHLPVTEGLPNRVNVGPAERWVSGLLGATLLAAGAKRRGAPGFLMGIAGAAMAHRAATGHCMLYESMGLNSADAEHPSDASDYATASVTILRPIGDVYGFWRDLENLAKVIPQVRSVRECDGETSHWVCEAPDGESVEFEARITEDLPNERIAWRSLPDAEMSHAGVVTFREAESGRGTVVRVEARFDTPGGIVPRMMAAASRKRPISYLTQSLRVIKQFLETGEVTTSAASLSQVDRQTRNWLSLTCPAPCRDQVEVASEGSFPASDAPAHTASTHA